MIRLFRIISFILMIYINATYPCLHFSDTKNSVVKKVFPNYGKGSTVMFDLSKSQLYLAIYGEKIDFFTL